MRIGSAELNDWMNKNAQRGECYYCGQLVLASPWMPRDYPCPTCNKQWVFCPRDADGRVIQTELGNG